MITKPHVKSNVTKGTLMTECLFCKIIEKTISSTIIYEDNEILVFNDINPCAEVHFLLIPKRHITNMLLLTESDTELMGLLMLKANQLAIAQGLGNGYKTLINTGVNGGQEVYHLHVHVFGNK